MYQIGIALSHHSLKRSAEPGIGVPLGSRVQAGVESFWVELQPGITLLSEQFDWCWVGRLLTTEREVAEGFDSVRQSVVEFLGTLMDVDEIRDYEKFVYFVSDWPEDGEVRYGNGTVSDLNGYMRLFNDWDEWVYQSSRKTLQQCQDRPFLVRLKHS